MRLSYITRCLKVELEILKKYFEIYLLSDVLSLSSFYYVMQLILNNVF
jgi:hypothetical protein